MIVFDLACAPAGHVFEAWFGSSGDYEDQRGRGLIQCPLCGAAQVDKAVMAPRVSAKGNQKEGRVPTAAPAAIQPDHLSSDIDGMKQMLAAMAAAQQKVLERSEHVGDRFAEEARAIHFGESPERPIHGRATPNQAQSLVDDGIPVAPLPFPVIEPGRKN